nr:hypothetical protein [Micromonospora sp. DSM 115978]
MLVALQAADGRGEKTIIVVSSGVDTVAPLDLRSAGFDFPREDYVEHLRTTNELPDLSGASVLLALTPPAGSQPALNLSAQRQLEGIWTAVITAAGASVEVVPSASTSPPLATNEVPSVPVPQVGSPVR